MYTLSYLDRANIGNAKTGGLEADFQLTSDQYSIILLVFFISYVIFEIPLNLIISRVRPSIYLSVLCVLVSRFAELGKTRCEDEIDPESGAPCPRVWPPRIIGSSWLLSVSSWVSLTSLNTLKTTLLQALNRYAGISEAGFAPGVAFYLSSWYKRYEVARRFAIYYTATAVSGAFSGLLAGVITQHLDGARGLAGWRWLFLIEGVGASFVGCFAWLILPDYPSNTKFLSPEERLLACQRLSYDGLANAQGAEGHMGEWQACKAMWKDFRVWVFVLLVSHSLGVLRP